MTQNELKKFLDKQGLSYFWSKIKDYVDSHDALRAYRHDSLTANAPSLGGWKLGTVKPWQSASAFASLRIGDENLMLNIEVTPGDLRATVQSGELAGREVYVGISSTDSLFLYADGGPIPVDSMLSVVEISDPYGALVDPEPISFGRIPSMVRTATADWGYGDRALLEFEKNAREAGDIQLQAEIDDLKLDRHTHANKDILDNYGPAGSASVPVYISADGTPVACADDFVHADELAAEAKARDDSDIAIRGQIKEITDKISPVASPSDQLVPQSYVDALGHRLEARYLGCDPYGSPFDIDIGIPSDDPPCRPLFPTDGSKPKFYYQGVETEPDENDVTVVTNDTTHASSIDPGNHATTRYHYDGKQWAFEYIINNNALSQTQLLAINSGITPGLNEAYSTHVGDAGLAQPTHHIGPDERQYWNDKVEQDQLDAEASARKNSDDILQGKIDAEASARETEDAAIVKQLADAVASLEEQIRKVDKKGLFVNGGVLRFGHRSDSGN